MSGYLTPGLYYEIVNDTPQENNVGRVDIAAFVGAAKRGPLHTPTRVDSMAHFQAAFGDFLPYSYLAYAVKAFFENGGTCCYIVRVATRAAAPAQVALTDQAGNVALRVVASSAGTWGNALSVMLVQSQTFTTYIIPSQDAGTNTASTIVQSVIGFTVGSLVRIFRQNDTQPLYRIVTAISPKKNTLTWNAPLEASFVMASADATVSSERIWVELVEFSLTLYQADQPTQTFSRLSFVPFSNYYIEHVINESSPQPPISVYVQESITQLFAQGTIPQQLSTLQNTLQLVERLPNTTEGERAYLQGGQDGIENLQPEDLIGNPDASEQRGLRALENIPDVAIIAIPDLMMSAPTTPTNGYNTQPYPIFSLQHIMQMQQAMIDFCEAQQRCIALLDPPINAAGTMLNVSEIGGWRQRFSSSYAALYYPQTIVQDPLRLNGQIVRTIPPCGHVAGMFARIDHEIGAYHAPANEALRGVQDVSMHVTVAEHGELNEQSVNCVRVFAGRGVRIYGARTLAADDALRYVNVRRLLIMLERSMETLMQWAVFEPNNYQLRQTLIVAITTLLEDLWLKGAFVGASAAEAFFVKCDAQNNPPELLNQGELLVEIGIAPSVPAEFVVLRIRRMLDTNDITE